MPVALRQLRIAVVHPRDRDGELLIRQFQRWGGPVDHIWPSPHRLDRLADIVVALVCQETRELCRTLGETAQSAVVGVLKEVDGASMRLLVEANLQAVLARPYEPAVVAAVMAVARSNFTYQKRLLSKIAKLDETLRSARKIERAKAVLMERRRLDEAGAYAFLREQAMKKRVPIGTIAGVVVDSDEVLPSGQE